MVAVSVTIGCKVKLPLISYLEMPTMEVEETRIVESNIGRHFVEVQNME